MSTTSTQPRYPDGDLKLPSLDIPLGAAPQQPSRRLTAVVIATVVGALGAALTIACNQAATEARTAHAAAQVRAEQPSAVDAAYRQGVADTLDALRSCTPGAGVAPTVRMVREQRS